MVIMDPYGIIGVLSILAILLWLLHINETVSKPNQNRIMNKKQVKIIDKCSADCEHKSTKSLQIKSLTKSSYIYIKRID